MGYFHQSNPSNGQMNRAEPKNKSHDMAMMIRPAVIISRPFRNPDE